VEPIVELINARLEQYTQFDDGCPPHLAEAIRYGLLGPGKRLRPRFVLHAAQACGGDAEAALPAACAVEMIHAYSLIHDDLPAMDDDDLRRGRPTCHKAFDEATAILAADALIALAFEVLARDVQPVTAAARCCRELAQAAGPCQLVGGQAADLAAEGADADLDLLQSIHRRKTGAMFCVSLRLGGITAGGDDAHLDALKQFGRHFGLAFQITDDLLDAAGNEKETGKRVGKDSRLGKMTYPGLLGIEESRRRAESLVAAACDALTPFGESAQPLIDIAKFILARNR